jgi:predicted DNA binding CopG/RHH family protein
MAKAKHPMTIIRSWDEVPAFANEAEEAAFWDIHELGDELLERMSQQRDPKLPPPRPRTKPIAIRFDESTIRRVRALAHRRGKGYQTLLKEFVTERLYEEEKREGLIGPSSSMREGAIMPTTTAKPRAVRGGYASGSKPVSELKPPPKTPGAGSKRASTGKK